MRILIIWGVIVLAVAASIACLFWCNRKEKYTKEDIRELIMLLPKEAKNCSFMKDRGIDLGNPSWWTLKNLKNAYRHVKNGSMPPPSENIQWDNREIWLRKAEAILKKAKS